MNRFLDIIGYVLTPINILVGVLDLPENLVKSVYLGVILTHSSWLLLSPNRKVKWIFLELLFISLLLISAAFSGSLVSMIKTVGLISLIFSFKHYSLFELKDYLNSRGKSLIVLYIIVGLVLFGQYGFSETTAKNSASIVLIGLFYLTGLYKDNIVATIAVLVTVLLLGSRSAILIMLLLVIVTNFRIKNLIIYGVLALVFSTTIITLANTVMSQKSKEESNLEGIVEAFEERNYLITQGLDVFWKSPVIGVGLGYDYYTDVIFGVRGGTYHVHNGYLNMLIEIGIINFICIILILYYRRNRLLNNDIFLMGILFVFLRAYGESYFLLNYGNIYSVLLIFVLFGNDFKKGQIPQ